MTEDWESLLPKPKKGFKAWFSKKKFRIIQLSVTILVVTGLVIYGVFYSNLMPNGKYWIKGRDVEVTLQVEETLHMEIAESITLAVLESINHTFGYQMVLENSEAIASDGITTYDRDWFGEHYFDDEGYGARARLRMGSLTEGKVHMIIRFFDGVVPVPENPGAVCPGISNRGDKIAMIIQNDEMESPESFFKFCEVMLHEFGHAFGLDHNIESPIMYTLEIDENHENEPEKPIPYERYLNWEIILDSPNGTMTEAMAYLGPEIDDMLSETGQHLWVAFEGHPSFFNFTPPHHMTFDGYVNNTFVIIERDPDTRNVTVINIESIVSMKSGDSISNMISIEAISFNIADYNQYWLDKEIDYCS